MLTDFCSYGCRHRLRMPEMGTSEGVNYGVILARIHEIFVQANRGLELNQCGLFYKIMHEMIFFESNSFSRVDCNVTNAGQGRRPNCWN